MTEFLIQCLYDYMRRMSVYRENDFIELCNNISFRRADPVDHLEMIIAQTRSQCTDEIFSDIYRIIAICRKEDYNDLDKK